MTISDTTYDHEIDGEVFELTIAKDDNHGRKPAVLIAHEWAGKTDHVINVAKKIAELGYVGIAIDLYGKGVFGTTTEECEALMTPLASDRPLLQSRLKQNLQLIKTLDNVDGEKIVAMGFCFGGLCVLDMARADQDVRGVASFHGLLGAPENTAGNNISAKVIAYHGYDDPMAKPEDLAAFEQEMTNSNADWQVHVFGGVMHAFTNPNANSPSNGTVYNQSANDRSWTSFVCFLEECLT